MDKTCPHCGADIDAWNKQQGVEGLIYMALIFIVLLPGPLLLFAYRHGRIIYSFDEYIYAVMLFFREFGDYIFFLS